MDKRKKIIISLSIALVLLIVLNYIVISKTNSDYIDMVVFKEAMLKGKQVRTQDLTKIKVKKTKESKQLLQAVSIEEIQDKVLKQDVSQGEVVTKDKLISVEETLEHDEKYQYISIPINDLSYPTCNRLKRGEQVTIYYTAKNKDVSNAIKDKERLYSSETAEGLVTCLLFDNVEVISLHNSTGKQASDDVITDILVRLNKEDAILVANLKSQGTFDIVLN